MTPGFRVEQDDFSLLAPRGLADWVDQLTVANTPALWMNEVVPMGALGDVWVQLAISAEMGETEWRGFANGNPSVCGSHLTALEQVAAQRGLSPRLGMIHVVMECPRFAGPTRSKLWIPELVTPLSQVIDRRLAGD
ncbi:MAG: hypothetical protein KDA63_07880 [Planctomycetales bacterium]|nr:hypothetical protein [Planctomycetales bacterium]